MAVSTSHYARPHKLRESDRENIKRQIRKENQLWPRAYREYIAIGNLYGIFLDINLHLRERDSNPVAKIILAAPESDYSGTFRKINKKPFTKAGK